MSSDKVFDYIMESPAPETCLENKLPTYSIPEYMVDLESILQGRTVQNAKIKPVQLTGQNVLPLPPCKFFQYNR